MLESFLEIYCKLNKDWLSSASAQRNVILSKSEEIKLVALMMYLIVMEVTGKGKACIPEGLTKV